MVLVSVLACISTACQSNALTQDDAGKIVLDSDIVRITGIVTDKEELLPDGTVPQTYEGALIMVREAIEAGTYKVSEDASEQTNYVTGKEIAKASSGKDAIGK